MAKPAAVTFSQEQFNAIISSLPLFQNGGNAAPAKRQVQFSSRAVEEGEIPGYEVPFDPIAAAFFAGKLKTNVKRLVKTMFSTRSILH
jgi:hypothetical protein